VEKFGSFAELSVCFAEMHCFFPETFGFFSEIWSSFLFLWWSYTALYCEYTAHLRSYKASLLGGDTWHFIVDIQGPCVKEPYNQIGICLNGNMYKHTRTCIDTQPHAWLPESYGLLAGLCVSSAEILCFYTGVCGSGNMELLSDCQVFSLRVTIVHMTDRSLVLGWLRLVGSSKW